MNDDSYYKSLDAFYALRTSALSGTAMRALLGVTTPGYNSNGIFGLVRVWVTMQRRTCRRSGR